jgi:sodium transport system permease protein
MNPFQVFRIVFRKEARELLRDRKTLFWLFAPPFILPALALIAAAFIGSQTARYVTDGFPVVVVNGDAAPGLLDTLTASPALIVTEATPETVAESSALVILTVPDDFSQTLEAGQTARIILTQRDSTYVSTLALGAIRSEIATYNQRLVEQRLQSIGRDTTWLNPVTLEETASVAATTSVTAPTQEGDTSSGGFSSIFLPLALTSWLIGGGLGLIVDTTVGEKERQTIELVLVTPASRIGVVAGKLAVVFLASLAVMGIWMIEGVFLSLVGDLGPQLLAAQTGADPSVSIGAILAQGGAELLPLIALLLLLIIPFVVVLNSLVMAFCSFASSYRESNGFLFLLQLILPAFVLLTVFGIGPEAGAGWYAAPILGTVVAIRDLFTNTLSPTGLAVSVVSTSIYAIIALILATYVYSREWALARR